MESLSEAGNHDEDTGGFEFWKGLTSPEVLKSSPHWASLRSIGCGVGHTEGGSCVGW